MANRITDLGTKGLTAGESLSERVDPKGSFTAWCKNSKVEFYYRWREAGKPKRKKIGNYPAMSVSQARKKAVELAQIASETDDLKFTLNRSRQEKSALESAAKAEIARMNSLGTLKQLCESYVEKLREDGKSSAKSIENYFKLNVYKNKPAIAALPAHQITADHILDILQEMHRRKVTTALNRTRDALQAAFNYGMQYEYSATAKRTSGLRFEILNNPVLRIPKERKYERKGSHVINETELATIWHQAPNHLNQTYTALTKWLICTGLHPAESLRLRVGDINLEDHQFYLIDPKSKDHPNLVPLNKFVMDTLKDLIGDRGENEPLFPARVSIAESSKAGTHETYSKEIGKFRDKLENISHFTARDFRRTVKTLMGKAGLSKEIRDRLQGHAMHDTSSKHYDMYDYWEEKLTASKVWESWLMNQVINRQKS